MSDQIPVGSPPVPPGRHAAPSGWYADPVDPRRERWWDGWQWSRQLREAETPQGTGRNAARAPSPPPVASPAPYGQQSYARPPQAPPPYGPPGPAPTTARAARTTEDGVPLSGWWRRVGAVMIDWLIVTALCTAILWPVYAAVWSRMEPIMIARMGAALDGRPLPDFDPATVITEGDQITVTLVGVAVGLIYNIGLLIWRGQTVGKLAAGIRVVPAEQGAHTGGLGWRPAVIRSLIWVVPGQVPLLNAVRVLDALWPLRQPRNQALHDLAARTQVIKTR